MSKQPCLNIPLSELPCALILVKWSDTFNITSGCKATVTLAGVLEIKQLLTGGFTPEGELLPELSIGASLLSFILALFTCDDIY